MFTKLRSLEHNFSVTKAASIVGVFTLIIKLVAIYRERLLSGTFGQGPLLDSYFSAFRIPDFLTNLFVLSTLSVAFLPIFTSIHTKDKEAAYRFANQVVLIGGAIMSVLCLILFIFSEFLTHRLVPGFTGQQFTDTLNLTRLFFLSPIIFTLGTIFGGILNAKKQFLISSFAPLLYNLGIIGGILWLYPKYGIIGLGYGAISGAIAQLLVQIIGAWREDYVFGFASQAGSEGLKKLWRLYVPRIFSFDLSNVTLLLGTVVGSALVAGSISALNQAYNLQSVPIGIFAYPIALAIFPVLSEHFAKGDEYSFLKTLEKSLTQTLFFIIPISVLALIYRAYVVRLILGTGNFTWDDTIRTFQVLGIFSVSFFSQALTTLLSRAFFARHNTKLPVAINLVALGINTSLGFLLGRSYGVTGLATAFVVASIFNAFALYVMLRSSLRRCPELQNGEALHSFDKTLLTSTIKICIASIAMGLSSFLAIQIIGPAVQTDTVLGLLIQCGTSGAAGLMVFCVVSYFLQIPEIKIALNFFRRMFFDRMF